MDMERMEQEASQRFQAELDKAHHDKRGDDDDAPDDSRQLRNQVRARCACCALWCTCCACCALRCTAACQARCTAWQQVAHACRTLPPAVQLQRARSTNRQLPAP
jgi:hypothetical protein